MDANPRTGWCKLQAIQSRSTGLTTAPAIAACRNRYIKTQGRVLQSKIEHKPAPGKFVHSKQQIVSTCLLSISPGWNLFACESEQAINSGVTP